ncbi:MAG: VCBS repeat-containing protein, partial [Planctomycetes bacterium]|nr:VCBS repeat-containing protein [Planctomycetota bacterium]
ALAFAIGLSLAPGTLAAQVPGLLATLPLPGLPRVLRLDVGTSFVLAPASDGTLDLQWVAGTLRTTPACDWRTADEPGKDAPLPASLVGGDFDGDGKVEFVQRIGERYHVLGADTAPTHGRTQGIWFSGRCFDLDGDGKAELPSHDGAQILQLVDALGTPRTEPLLDLNAHLLPGTAIEAGTAGDYDRDGDVDLVLALPERGLVWLPNLGPKSATRFGPPVPLWPYEPGTRVSGLLLEDFDGDGWPDLFVASCARGGSGPFAFQHDEERRDRTPRQEAELRRLEQKPAARPPEASLPQMPGTLHSERPDPFARLLEWKEHQDRARSLRCITTPWHARPVVVHVRKGRA